MNSDRYAALKARHRDFRLEAEEIDELFAWMEHLERDNAILRVDMMAARAAISQHSERAEVQQIACEGT